MRKADAIGALLMPSVASRRYAEPLHVLPPREGMRPGTAAGKTQTLF
ncbi:hypothetical protein GCM10027265_11080 [Jatrophihabitans fulvus]